MCVGGGGGESGWRVPLCRGGGEGRGERGIPIVLISVNILHVN